MKVTGPGATDAVSRDITGDLPIQPGDRLNHSNYDALKGGLLRAAATYGYLDARMVRNEMRVDPQAYVAQTSTIEFETGERYRFGATTITQRRHRRRAGAALPALPGRTSLSTPRELLRTQFALDDSQYFSTVEVLPEDRDREKHTVPISISAEPNRRQSLLSSAWVTAPTPQVRGTVAWENRRINHARPPLPHGDQGRRRSRSRSTRATSCPSAIRPPKSSRCSSRANTNVAPTSTTASVNFTPSLTHLRGLVVRRTLSGSA